ncbi:hypothetical protein [Streptosporangium minutum]|uniref:Cytochrome C biogenesis protein transmembrane domain-containing protein n=1 Tax=Streptosporangium minutum TaxID=569862 RepID=A0A243RMJ9_9ACTN|nr:hypothetical protein [Streptosporangium minutum]OUC95464.1 hypothetical protein CA984_18540 [Streptosporangium minutum]
MTQDHTVQVPSETPGRAGVRAAPVATSVFVNGWFPRRRGLIILVSGLVGFLLTIVWSAEFVDQTIGDNVANTLLGHDAKETPIAGIAAGIAFAFVSGLAGSFTACNIAAFGAVAPLLGNVGSRWGRLAHALKPLGWLSIGMITVSAVYGAIVGFVGTSMPQFSTAQNTPGTLSPRGIQSMVVYGLIGLAMLYMGLAALGVVRDPFARISRRFPNAPMVFMGALIGGFLIGRPFALFRQMFRDAAESGNPLYGAAAFVLQSLGNIVIMTVLFLILSSVAGSRLQRWLTAKPSRIAVLTASSLIVAGVFTFLYWDVRMLARREIIPWYPTAPWS